jgi:hypothetical protein
MIDYNQPWGWVAAEKQGSGNTLAPLGGVSQEAPPGQVQIEPSLQDQMTKKVGMAVIDKAASSAAKGMSEAGAGVGPLGAAIGGAMEGDYDGAAGAAAGAAIGTAFGGPIGGMIGSKIGDLGGNAIGSLFGFADGSKQVPAKTGVAKSIWDSIVGKGRQAMEESVKAATGNSGGLGQAKQALATRKERLDAEEKKAMGYADGTMGAGGKGVGGAMPASMPAQGLAGGKSAGSSGVNGRAFGSVAPTGYYGDAGSPINTSGVTSWKPTMPMAGTPVAGAQSGPIANPIWGNPNLGGFGGGDSAGEGGGGTSGGIGADGTDGGAGGSGANGGNGDGGGGGGGGGK